MGRFKVELPDDYNIEEFIRKLEMLVPPDKRFQISSLSYDVDGSYRAEVVDLCEGSFKGEVDCQDSFEDQFYRDSGRDNDLFKIPARPADDPFEAIFSMEGLTLEQFTKLYSQLAKVFHPDAGGTNAQMTKLNAAYEKAKKNF
jgi:hypothetical protein